MVNSLYFKKGGQCSFYCRFPIKSRFLLNLNNKKQVVFDTTVTLENAIYMNVKNDVAFIIDCRMGLYEHQATVNPNLPVRYLIYVAKEYQGMVSRQSLYSSKLVKLPTPDFVGNLQ